MHWLQQRPERDDTVDPVVVHMVVTTAAAQQKKPGTPTRCATNRQTAPPSYGARPTPEASASLSRQAASAALKTDEPGDRRALIATRAGEEEEDAKQITRSNEFTYYLCTLSI